MFASGDRPAAALLAGLVGEPFELGRLCPACGSSRHGRPWLRLPSGREADLSIAYAGEQTLVGVLFDPAGRRLGVDLEPDDAPTPDVRAWVRAEAFLKATGEGLRRDPATVGGHEPGARWGVLDVPGHVAAWCVVAPDPG